MSKIKILILNHVLTSGIIISNWSPALVQLFLFFEVKTNFFICSAFAFDIEFRPERQSAFSYIRPYTLDNKPYSLKFRSTDGN